MRLKSVKYQDSCIYIELKIEKESRKFLQSIRNVYVHYKIQVFDQVVQEIYLVKTKDLICLKSRLILVIYIDIIHAPDDCYFILDSLKFTFQNNSKKVQNFGIKYLIADIERLEQPHLILKRKEQSKKIITTKNPPDTVKPKETQQFKEISVSNNGLKILELDKNPQDMLKSIEQKIGSQLELEYEQLNKELSQIYSDTLNLLITNLPKPYSEEDLQFNDALINSVRKYVNHELISAEGD